MAYTYTDDPVSSGTAAQKRDAVRFLIQDTDTTAGKVTDAQIAFALVDEANAYAAAALCCESLVALAGSVKSRSIDDTSVTYDVGFYQALAVQLRRKARAKYEGPFCGGISADDKDTTSSDSDYIAPDFKRGMFAYPGTGDPINDGTTS